MKYLITKNKGYSLATIEEPKSKTIFAILSADIHKEKSTKSHSVGLLYADALLSGAGKYTRAQFLDALNILGASVSTSISNSVFALTIRSKADVFSKVLTLVEAMLTAPHFETKEIKRIKQIVTNEIKESKENSKVIAHEELRNTLYGAHDRRYTPSDEALIKAIATVTANDLKKLHTQISDCIWSCSVAGSKEHSALFDASIRKIHKGSVTNTDAFSVHQQKPPQPGVYLKNIPSRQNIDFSIGAPIPITLHHPDYLPLMFGITVLGKWGGFTGRLMSTVRDKEGLTYGIYAGTESFYSEEQGYWRIMTFFSPEKSIQGLTSTFREVKKMFTKGITQEELERFTKILHTNQVLKNDSTTSLLSELHAYHMQGFSLEEIAEHKKRILELTLEEVNTAIKTYLDPQTLTISGAGPISTVKKELQTFLKTV